jgi:hypothetical protein
MLLIALAFPLLLMGLLMLMDWIEAPLRSEATADGLPAFLEDAPPEEIEIFVRDGLKTALERHWLRQRLARRLLPGR